MGTDYTGVDRRKFRRVAVSFVVFYKVNYPLVVRVKIGDKEINALAADISEEGIAVLTDHELPPATNVSVKFIMSNDKATNIDDQRKSISVHGELRYNLKIDKGYRMGIKFLDLAEDDRRFIANFVAVNQ